VENSGTGSILDSYCLEGRVRVEARVRARARARVRARVQCTQRAPHAQCIDTLKS